MNPHPVVNAASSGENEASPAIPATPTPPVDVKTMVTQALEAAGHSTPSGWEARLPEYYADAPDDSHRMFLINRTWRLILGELQEVDTSNQRYCLVDHVKVDKWIAAFTQGVVPCAIEHNLPLTTS